MSKLESEIGSISSSLALKQRRFDAAMDRSRELVRLAGVIITKLHNGGISEARSGLARAGVLSRELAKYKEFDYSTKQSQQEYSEAKIFFSIKTGGRLPSLKEVGTDGEAYLMGMMDVFGELKREIIGALSEGDVKSARAYYSIMVEMFDATRSVRFAEAVLQGFRRKQDVARIQMEGSATELLAFSRKAGGSRQR